MGITLAGNQYLNIFNCYSLVNIEAEGSGIASGCGNLVNCFNGGTINGGDSSGVIKSVSDNHTTQIINCCNLGAIECGEEWWNRLSGFVCSGYSGNLEIMNSCSIGQLIKNSGRDTRRLSYTFVYNGGLKTLDFTNCYYLQDIVDNCKYINANEGTTALTDTNVQEVLDSLNNYVEEHKNDYYEDYGITLVNWVIGENGYPVLDLKYE